MSRYRTLLSDECTIIGVVALPLSFGERRFLVIGAVVDNDGRGY